MAAEILSRQISPVESFISSLRSPRPTVRIWALTQIGKLSPSRAAEFQLDVQVADMLRDPDSSVQAQALLTLSKQGDRGARHSNEIARKLSHPARAVKLAALQALGDLGPSVASNALDVVAVMNHEDPAVAGGACSALGKMKVTSLADKLTSKLESSREVEVIIAVCNGLSHMDRRVDVVGRLLSHEQSSVKAAAAMALLGMTKAEEFLPDLTQLLSEADPCLRHNAASTMRSLGSFLPPQKAALGALLKGAPGVAAAAAYVLASLGPAAADQAPALEALLNTTAEDSSASLTATGAARSLPAGLRKPAVAAIEALGLSGAADRAPRLLELLKSPDAEVRLAAAEALGRLRAQSAVPALLLGLKDPSPAVIRACCSALGRMPSAETAASVAELLKDPHPAVRAGAAEALAEMGDTQAFVASIANLLDDKAPPVQVAALHALATCGEQGQLHAADVCRLAAQGDDRTRVAALQTLSRLGERGAAFALKLEPLLDDSVPEVCSAARKTLEYFKTGKDAVPSLLSLPKVDELPALDAPVTGVDQSG
ncbi:unnamed protein product [Durusdinium trenchii]|uniref:HEAT repeat domain-containing protein n=1 Tax=Durusdinium trenchii TaxID=1381693 RepID=A0ABP0MNN8_9DINO